MYDIKTSEGIYIFLKNHTLEKIHDRPRAESAYEFIQPKVQYQKKYHKTAHRMHSKMA